MSACSTIVRVLAFIVCLALTIGSVLWVYFNTILHYFFNYGLPDYLLSRTVYAQAIAFLFLSLYGLYASCCGNTPQAYNRLTILAGIIFLFLLLALNITFSDQVVEKEHTKFVERLKDSAIYYDWKKDKSSDPKVAEATKLWDGFQKMYCCGFSGPHDWDEWRPKTVPANAYPSSCCDKFQDSTPYCFETSSLFSTKGCLEELKPFETTMPIIYKVAAYSSLILALMAYVLKYFRGQESMSTNTQTFNLG